MAGGFGVEPDEVRSHAKKVSEVGDRLGEAGSAAGEITLNNQAFGLIGQFLVPGVMAVGGLATGAIKLGEQATESMFEALRETADTYEESDEQNSADLPNAWEM